MTASMPIPRRPGRATHNTARTFLVPALLALVTIGGLISALLGDGLWDAASWVALAAPLVVIAVCVFRSRPSPSSR